MAVKNQNWMLFGIDTREFVRVWKASWTEFLWGEDSPIRKPFDEKIKLISESSIEIYQSGNKVDEGGADLEAIALPDSLFLERKLILPIMSLGELKTILVNEVIASSPFAQEDTSWGWMRELSDTGQFIVRLALASNSDINDYLRSRYDALDLTQAEVWARVDGHWVVFQGFGERLRMSRYTRRLIRVSMLTFFLFTGVLLSIGIDAAVKKIRLDQLHNEEKLVREQASRAMVFRKRLGEANRTVNAVNDLMSKYPSPRAQLVQLTALLGDDAFLQEFRITGNQIRLRGKSKDAAKLMRQLADEKNYANVTAPQAIIRLGNSGMEQFNLDIEIQDEAVR